MPHPTPALPECQLPDQLCRPQTSLAQGHILDMLLLTDTPNPHGFSLALEQLPGPWQSPQATSSSAQTQGLDYPIASHSTHLHLMPQAPTLLPVSPYPQECTSPESTSAAPCRAGKSWGA